MSTCLGKLLKLAKGQGFLVRSFHVPTDIQPTTFDYHFEPSGKEIKAADAEELINRGLYIPHSDGLFGADTAQTFVLAGAVTEEKAA